MADQRRNGKLSQSDTPFPTLASRNFWALQAFLASHNFVHRHLTASSILLTTKDVVKIGGFDNCRYSDEALWSSCREADEPLKWLAPETFSEPKFSTESDV